jgi:hypothetical protein
MPKTGRHYYGAVTLALIVGLVFTEFRLRRIQASLFAYLIARFGGTQ